MKSLILILIGCIGAICGITSNTYANATDSGKCPWKLPFRISVKANGILSTRVWNVPTHNGAPLYDSVISRTSEEYFSITIDSVHDTTYFATGDTITVNRYYWIEGRSLNYIEARTGTGLTPSLDSALVLIQFATGSDSVLSLTFHTSHWDGGTPMENESSFTFQASLFNMNDSSIFSNDSSMNGHSISLSYSENTQNYPEGRESRDEEDFKDDFGDFRNSTLNVSSVDVSGIFQPTHFSGASSSIKSISQNQRAISISSESGELHCSFAPSDYTRSLKVFSVIESHITSIPIGATKVDAIVPNLPHGYYFLQLGNQMTKVYLAE